MLRFDRPPAVRALPSTSQSDTTMDHLAPTKRPQVRLVPRSAGVHVGNRPAIRAARKAPQRAAQPRRLPGLPSRLLPPHARDDRHGSQMDGSRAHVAFNRLVQLGQLLVTPGGRGLPPRARRGIHLSLQRHSAMRAAARSAIAQTVALVFAETTDGITDASATRSPSSPRTRNSGSTTAMSSIPIRQVPA